MPLKRKKLWKTLKKEEFKLQTRLLINTVLLTSKSSYTPQNVFCKVNIYYVYYNA